MAKGSPWVMKNIKSEKVPDPNAASQRQQEKQGGTWSGQPTNTYRTEIPMFFDNTVGQRQQGKPNGCWSKGLKWHYDKPSKTLSVSGHGGIEDIGTAPWRNFTNNIQHVSLSDGITHIGMWAFYGCISLKSITIPKSVTYIGKSAFSGCKGLKSITIPENVTYIEGGAFFRCKGLKSITIPKSVKRIGDEPRKPLFEASSDGIFGDIFNDIFNKPAPVFDECKRLRKIYFLGSEEEWDKINIDDATNEFICSCTIIYNQALSSAQSMNAYKTESPTISDNAASQRQQEKPSGSWSGQLTNAYRTESPMASGNTASQRQQEISSGCWGKGVKWQFDRQSGTLGISGHGGIKDNGYGDAPWHDIKKGDIQHVSLSAGITGIGEKAFLECGSLESIIIPEGVGFIGEQAFSYCGSLEGITIPESVTSIGIYAFYKCESLESITIPSHVISIGEAAFGWCISLRSIIIPSRVASIEEWSFLGCESMESITIPRSIKQIGNGAFSKCTSLKEINFLGSQKEWKKIKMDDDTRKLIRSCTIVYKQGSNSVQSTNEPIIGSAVNNTILKEPIRHHASELMKYVCTVCGYINEGSKPQKCPVCLASEDRFEIMKNTSVNCDVFVIEKKAPLKDNIFALIGRIEGSLTIRPNTKMQAKTFLGETLEVNILGIKWDGRMRQEVSGGSNIVLAVSGISIDSVDAGDELTAVG